MICRGGNNIAVTCVAAGAYRLILHDFIIAHIVLVRPVDVSLAWVYMMMHEWWFRKHEMNDWWFIR